MKNSSTLGWCVQKKFYGVLAERLLTGKITLILRAVSNPFETWGLHL